MEGTMERRTSVAQHIPLAPAGASAKRHSAAILIAVCSIALGALSGSANEDEGQQPGATATAIRHVIVILGENRGFDHVFATYKPRDGQHIGNLLSLA